MGVRGQFSLNPPLINNDDINNIPLLKFQTEVQQKNNDLFFSKLKG